MIFGGYSKIRIAFKPTTLLNLYSKMVISWEISGVFEKATFRYFLPEAYLEPDLKSMMELFGESS